MLLLPPGLTARTPVELDHPRILAAIAAWWETPNRALVGLLLPRLFLQFFTQTSRIVETADGDVAAFLIGFRSADDPTVAYIHFVGVGPDHRQAGLGRALYEDFFSRMTAAGCTEVRAITGPANLRSQAFHAAMGFTLHGDTDVDGVMAYPDYDGPDQPRVTFVRGLG